MRCVLAVVRFDCARDRNLEVGDSHHLQKRDQLDGSEETPRVLGRQAARENWGLRIGNPMGFREVCLTSGATVNRRFWGGNPRDLKMDVNDRLLN
jgi:hypothetical protein